MAIVKGEWVDINVIASEVALKAKQEGTNLFPFNTDDLEQSLYRAINILNDAGFTVVREK